MHLIIPTTSGVYLMYIWTWKFEKYRVIYMEEL